MADETMTRAGDGPTVASTGISGLDEILAGGLPAHCVHLIEGDPGSGKTTIALQFLLAGVAQKETCLYVALSETSGELRAVARSHGWRLDSIHIHELTPSEGVLKPDEQYTLFHPSDVELSDTIMAVVEQVSQLNPSRVVIDSLAEMRLLAAEPHRYRRQILALKQFFVGRRATVVLVDDRPARRRDLQVQSISDGVLRLEQRVADYGVERRRLQIAKLRGVKFRGGYHDFRIETGGIRVFPRIVAADYRVHANIMTVPSGIAELDSLLGGGLATGSTTALIGPAGVGKTVLATHYAAAMAGRGSAAALYLFDERLNTFVHRTERLGVRLSSLIAERRIMVEQLDPAQVTPGEFATAIRRRVEEEDVRFVLIDSLNGYLSAMQDDAAVLVQLHELLTFLNERGVVTILIVAQHGVLGTGMAAPLDVSYLADTLILLRFFEAAGAVRQAISVVKKRTGEHEHTIREFQITSTGPRVGLPLTNFHGVMTGVPQYTGSTDGLLSESHVNIETGRGRSRRPRARSRPRR
jgi:circadian clock protein KaiC